MERDGLVARLQRGGDANVVGIALANARRTPDRLALAIGEERATYRELVERMSGFAAGLRRERLVEGDRVALLALPSVDFYALAMALLGSGLVAVLADGQMTARRLVGALAVARPRAVVSLRKALRLWPALPVIWRARRFSVDGAAPGVETLDTLHAPGGTFASLPRDATDAALVSFTSGTSGRAKGVDRTHGILLGQHIGLREEFPDRDDDVDMTFFPAMALHSLGCGIGCVLPPVDLRRPGEADPAVVLAAMRRHGVTRLSTAPAFLTRLLDHLERTGERVPTLRAMLIGGAPVARRLCRRVGELLPEVDARVAYGSTEAEPISGLPMRDAAAAEGEGLLVGTPVEIAEVELLSRPPPPEIGAEGLAPYRAAPGEAGEVVVRGPHVNRRYINDPEAERANKIKDGASVWHRTGDVARRDAAGRIWLLSRRDDSVVHRGRLVHPLPLEDALAERDELVRAALVAHPAAPEGELLVEAAPGRAHDALDAARRVLAAHELGTLRVDLVERIPVDARHQSKIDRVALRTLRQAGRSRHLHR